MMSDETTLVPCPWCGVGIKLHAINYPWADGEPGWNIWHDDMDKARKKNCPMVMGCYNTREEAIAAWNTRAPVEYDGWFYLPKPKESIVQYGEQRTEKTEHGYKVTQPVEVIESAIRSWGDELGEYIMKRICEAWNTRTHGTLTAEQVRKAVEGHGNIMDNRLYEDWQAVADELNAELESEPNPDGLPVGLTISDDGALLNWRGENYVRQGASESGTCHSTTDGSAWCFACSECGKTFPRNNLHLACNHGEINYCPNCGRKVMK